MITRALHGRERLLNLVEHLVHCTVRMQAYVFRAWRVALDDRLCLPLIELEAPLDGLRRVVERSPPRPASASAREAAAVRHVELEDDIERAAKVAQQLVEASACAIVRGKPSSTKPGACRHGRVGPDEPDHQVVRDKVARS